MRWVQQPFVVVVGMAVLTTLGDYCLKRASLQNSMVNFWLAAGCCVYGATALGWTWTMRFLPLATIGATYAISMVLLMTTLGFVFFKESLNWREFLGIALALFALALLSRHAS